MDDEELRGSPRQSRTDIVPRSAIIGRVVWFVFGLLIGACVFGLIPRFYDAMLKSRGSVLAGAVLEPRDLPFFGENFASLNADGPIVFAGSTFFHHSTHLVLSCRTGPMEATATCSGMGLAVRNRSEGTDPRVLLPHQVLSKWPFPLEFGAEAVYASGEVDGLGFVEFWYDAGSHILLISVSQSL